MGTIPNAKYKIYKSSIIGEGKVVEKRTLPPKRKLKNSSIELLSLLVAGDCKRFLKRHLSRIVFIFLLKILPL